MYRDSSSVPGEEDSKKLETFPRLPLRQLAPDIPQYVIAWALPMVPFISLKPQPPSIHSFLKSSISLSTFMAVAPRSLSLAGDARRRYIAPIWTTYRIGPSVDHQLAQALHLHHECILWVSPSEIPILPIRQSGVLIRERFRSAN